MERGSTPVEAAILAPGVLMLVFAVVQGGLFFHAQNVAVSAAQVGVEAARVEHGSSGAGQAATTGYLRDVAPSLMSAASVSASRGSGTVTVRVRAPAPRVVPGLPLPRVDASATGAVERVTRP